MTMVRKTGSLLAILALAWIVVPLSARAATTWNTTVTPVTNTCPAGSCSSQHEGLATSDPTMLPYGNQIQFTSSSSPSLPLFATSYFVSTNASSSALQAANIEVYTGTGYGIGVTSETTAAVKYGSDPTPAPGSQFTEDVGNSPGHTVDNQGVYDMVVFQLPSSNFDVTQILLNTFTTSQYASGAADFTIFVGGNSSANALSLAGFAGVTLAQLTGTYGFTEINYTNATGGTFNVNAGNLTGRYLIVAASLTNTNRNDDFKIASIVGNTLLTKVPEPSSISLLFVAGMMLLYFRRRRAAIRC